MQQDVTGKSRVNMLRSANTSADLQNQALSPERHCDPRGSGGKQSRFFRKQILSLGWGGIAASSCTK
jgi:hypothetical protein